MDAYYRRTTNFMELHTLVIYDVEDDGARTRVAEACKDFGLERIQYSCFRGRLSQNKREELYERMSCLRKWRKRSSVKITERTHEEATEALHAGREGRHSEEAF